MIKTINSGTGISVSSASTNWPSFYNNSTSSNNTLVGQVRYNGATQNMEVYDVLNWAKTKMVEELRLKQLAANHPSLKDALDALQQAEEKVKIVTALVTT